MVELNHAEHFKSMEQQGHAATLGMWAFLASEVLLFAGAFTLYGAYRAHYPAAWDFGVAHNLAWLGTTNTVILLVSSYFVALSTHFFKHGKKRTTLFLIGLTVLFGVAFLCLKGYEYASHFHHGIFPGGSPTFVLKEHAPKGTGLFFTLYFLMTGLHAVHVIAGMSVLTWLAFRIRANRVIPEAHHPLELGAMYWHLVDLIWIFLWPLFYLAGGKGG